jgi:hypothetical protein
MTLATGLLLATVEAFFRRISVIPHSTSCAAADGTPKHGQVFKELLNVRAVQDQVLKIKGNACQRYAELRRNPLIPEMSVAVIAVLARRETKALMGRETAGGRPSVVFGHRRSWAKPGGHGAGRVLGAV